MINVLYVDEFTLADVDVYARPQEFFDQHRYVETVGIESGEVATLDGIGQFPGYLLERRTVCHVFIIDTVNGRRTFRNVHLRIDSHAFGLFIAVRVHFDVA